MWQCRIAPSLGGGFEGTPEQVWGTKPYLNQEDPTVFFGLYGLPDFFALWRHKGQKAVLWAGSDIRHLQGGYWLEDDGGLRLDNKDMAAWINKYCLNYCENEVEYQALLELGIEAEIVPSFLGNVKDFEPCFHTSHYPKVYTSVSGDDFELYGWDKIVEVARENPNIEFHFYGNTTPYEGPSNCIFHGRVPKEQMNEEIKDMQGCIRATEFDGFSEIVAKAYLYEQYPISIIPYPHSIPLHSIHQLRWKTEPNTEGRNWLLANVNKYPWNNKT